MPAFKLHGNLVWFGAFKNHVGFYPRKSAIEEFKEKLVGYEVSKVQGTVKFPLNKPIPFDLIKEIVKFRANENHGNDRVKYSRSLGSANEKKKVKDTDVAKIADGKKFFYCGSHVTASS